MAPEIFENLFTYGTLRDEPVQLAHFGRKLDGVKETLAGYVRGTVTIDGILYPILRRADNADNTVEGIVFQLTPRELANADAYEGPTYKRVLVDLVSGTRAWAYIDAKNG